MGLPPSNGWLEDEQQPKREASLVAPHGSAPTNGGIVGFVRRQIAHKIGRRTWSNQWSEGHIHDAATMIQDYLEQNND